MPLIRGGSFTVLFCFLAWLSPALAADTLKLPPHPRLLLSSNGVAELKLRVATASWARDEWQALLKDTKSALTKGFELPPRGGNWSHNYVCPEHGSRLSQGKKIGPWKWEHICPTGPHTLLGDPRKAELDFDGNGIGGEHGRLARATVDHGLVFQVTGDPAHAQRAREILLAYAARYKTYPLHDNRGVAGRGARVASQSLTEASWLIEMAQGADLVWSTFSEAERANLRDNLFMPALEEVIINRRPSIHNIQCRINSAIGLAGFLLGDAKLIARAIDDPGSGYHQQMAKGVMPDGMWYEGSSGYHFFTVDGLWPLTEAARNCGIDLYGPTFRKMFDAPLLFAMPDRQMPDFNDSGISSLARQAPNYELAFARYRQQSYVSLIQLGNRRNRMALLYGETKLPSGEAPQPGSRNFPDSGYAILQRGVDRDALWLCLKYGPHGGGHGHPDKNHFLLYARGEIVAPDGGTHAYGSKLHSTWDKATAAHNTLVINQTNQLPAQGRSLAFGSENSADYSMTDAGPIYRDVQFIRTAVMLNSNLIVFVDQVRATEPVVMDLHYHQMGSWKSLPKGKAWTPGEEAGYRYLQEGAIRRTSEQTMFGITVKTNWATSVTLSDDAAGEIITGYGILKTTEDRVPWLIQRRHAQATAFVWALALDGTPVQLALEPLRSAGAVLDPSEAVGVKVRSGKETREIVVNPQGRAVSTEASPIGETTQRVVIR